MSKRLTDIEVEEVSLVRRAANRRKFLLLKEDDVDELVELLKLALENEDDVDEALGKAKLSDKAAKAVKGALKLLNAYKDELPDDILKTLADLGGYGYAEPEKKGDDEDDDEDLEKMDDLPEWAAEKIEALQKAADENRTALENEIAARKEREYLAKAQEYDNIPGKPEELAQLLMKADGAGDEFGEALGKLLEGLNTSMGQMYKQLGSDATPTGGGAMEEVTKQAQALLEKSQDVKTLEQAITKVLEQNPDLYKRYLDENESK